MSTPTKILGFLVALVAVFAAAVGIGRATGPVDAAPAADHSDMAGDDTDATDGMEDMDDMDGAEAAATSIPKGLMVSQNGFTFRLVRGTAWAGPARPVSFTIEGPDGSPVTEFDVEHEKQLHLIAVRRDFTGFQHVHPEMAADGTWTTPIDVTAGHWRLYADFKATGAEAVTLGTDLAVRGDYEPRPAPADSRTAPVDDYAVTLDGDLVAGEEAKLTLNVTRDGSPVTDLDPYLGAYGHLVALRAGDLAYLHVHPEGTPDDGETEPGPDVVFYTEVPSPGRYHLYLDFQHEGVVRTAAFTVTVSGSTTSDLSPDDQPGGSGDHADDADAGAAH